VLPRSSDVAELCRILDGSTTLIALLALAPSLGLPDWYFGAGCVTQTVWNALHGFDLSFGIKDHDLAYYDATDISYEGEDAVIRRGRTLFGPVSGTVEIRNQARVHVWHERHFGYPISPYRSVEDAIRAWPTTASAVGVRRVDGRWTVCAPHGLGDLFGMIVRPNKVNISEQVYRTKVERWTALWPRLTVMPW